MIVISGGEGPLLCRALVQIIDDPSIFGGRILEVKDANLSDNAETTGGEGQTRLLRLTRLVPVDSGPKLKYLVVVAAQKQRQSLGSGLGNYIFNFNFERIGCEAVRMGWWQ